MHIAFTNRYSCSNRAVTLSPLWNNAKWITENTPGASDTRYASILLSAYIYFGFYSYVIISILQTKRSHWNMFESQNFSQNLMYFSRERMWLSITVWSCLRGARYESGLCVLAGVRIVIIMRYDDTRRRMLLNQRIISPRSARKSQKLLDLPVHTVCCSCAL